MSMLSEATTYDTTVEPGPERFARMAQEMFAQAKIDDAMTTVLRLTQETFPADAVTILLAGADGVVAHAAASTRTAARADELQMEFHQGPSLQALKEQEDLTIDDLRFDARYRFWAPQAADLGFRSVLSLSLADDDTSGALTLYSRHPSFFGADDVARGGVFAQHAAISLAITREREMLLNAVDSRVVIGQAQGILMERYDFGSEQAFTVLRRSASAVGQQIRLVAEEVIRTRSLPGSTASEQSTAPLEPGQPLRMVTSQEGTV